jgi:NAD(P)-dependent dehydrogenase (short-subunit alcohol dehydrogenase family)
MADSAKVMLVTGAGRGIGGAVAELAAKRGYRVGLAYRSSRTQAEGIAKRIAEAGGTARAFAADISRPDEAAHLVDSLCRELGAISALVNNAALSEGRSRLIDADAEGFRRMVETNLLGTVYCSRYAAERMARSRGGSGGGIVNVSSDAARTGGNNIAVYAATKGAINVLTVSLARELGEEGIRVNAVSPGVIDTGEPADVNRADGIPIGRMGTPADVAEAVLWLLSEQASYITGAVVPVHGGR